MNYFTLLTLPIRNMAIWPFTHKKVYLRRFKCGIIRLFGFMAIYTKKSLLKKI